MKQDGKPPKAAYGIRLDGERYQLDGQPPPSPSPRRHGRPAGRGGKANATAAEETFQEMA